MFAIKLYDLQSYLGNGSITNLNDLMVRCVNFKESFSWLNFSWHVECMLPSWKKVHMPIQHYLSLQNTNFTLVQVVLDTQDMEKLEKSYYIPRELFSSAEC